MHLVTPILALLASLATAMPADTTPFSALLPRQDLGCPDPALNPTPTVVRVMVFADEACSADCQHRDMPNLGPQFDDMYHGGFRVTNRRSIQFQVLDPEFLCEVVTWSGPDGRGSSLHIMWNYDGDCVDVPYASVTFNCWKKDAVLAPARALPTMPGPVIVALPGVTAP